MTATPTSARLRTRAAAFFLAASALTWLAGVARGDVIWIEGEKPVRHTMHRHDWYDGVKRGELSGGDYLSNFDDKEPGLAWYLVTAKKAGDHEFWVRANPEQARLSYKLNDGPETLIDFSKNVEGQLNIAADGGIDLRFIAWVKVGSVKLNRGANSVRFRTDSAKFNHGALDCFVFSTEPFTPRGTLRPDQRDAAAKADDLGDRGWFAFNPRPDPFSAKNAIDLRSLNETKAGDGGFIAAKDGRFVHSRTGRPVRFWAVNGPAGKDRDALRREARILAKRGVNLVRIVRNYCDQNGALDMAAVKLTHETVAALKAEGIYSHLFIYFPVALHPKPGTPWLPGYDGQKQPFAALFFNKEFQKQYRSWVEALLLTPREPGGTRLVDDPAVAGFEIINEDSYLFWTFRSDNIPDPEMRIVETEFAGWLKAQYGSVATALKRWDGVTTPRDAPREGRVGFRQPWNVFNDKTERDKDTVRFLVQSQRGFYDETAKYLRGIGFKGVITASNWKTASPEVLGPLEVYSYTPGDFIDRHAYFGGTLKGEFAEWSIRDGHMFRDRSALRFDPDEPGKPKVFVNPVMDPSYDGKPSMLSETTWTRPNRFRSEAPLFLACYGALQGSDAIVHFTFDGASWSVKPGYFMQAWTLMAPAMMGQFPAAAKIFREGLVAEGDVLIDLNLKLADLYNLKGTPLPQDAGFDELRLKDVPKGSQPLRAGQVIDPLVHLVGRTNVRFSENDGKTAIKDLTPFIDHARQTVVSTTGELKLDYGKGVLTIDAPSAQGVSGMLADAATSELKDLSVTSTMPLGHVVAVSLDGLPLGRSARVLLQVMSEEKPTGFRTEPADQGFKRIASIGRDPWRVRRFEGLVRFKRKDAAALKVTPLDPNGDPVTTGKPITAAEIRLDATTLYYLIEAPK